MLTPPRPPSSCASLVLALALWSPSCICFGQAIVHRPSTFGGIDPDWQPKTADDFLARGYVLIERQQLEKGRADLERALALRPRWYLANYTYGIAAYRRETTQRRYDISAKRSERSRIGCRVICTAASPMGTAASRRARYPIIKR